MFKNVYSRCVIVSIQILARLGSCSMNDKEESSPDVVAVEGSLYILLSELTVQACVCVCVYAYVDIHLTSTTTIDRTRERERK